jgi:hypothetical protein
MRRPALVILLRFEAPADLIIQANSPADILCLRLWLHDSGWLDDLGDFGSAVRLLLDAALEEA